MKIGIVCYPSVGGSGVLATELGHQLALRGHEVHFITYEIPFRLRLEEERVYFHQVEINQYDLFKYPDYALTLAVKIADVVKRKNLDVLHVHYAIPHATSAYLAKQMLKANDVSVITTLHGTDITLVGREPSYYPIVKHSIENSDVVTAVSHDLRARTTSLLGIKKGIDVIYNFFEPKPELLGQQPKRRELVADDEKLLVHASNFRPVKRPRDVVSVFAKVRKRVKCKLALVGTGAGIEEVHCEARQRGLTEDILFLGRKREIDPYIASADCLLLPSSEESFGLVALEAMAYGVPVVASNVGGLTELIEDGNSGFLASVGDIEQMASSVIKLLTDPSCHQSISQKAQKRSQTLFSAENIVPQYEKCYSTYNTNSSFTMGISRKVTKIALSQRKVLLKTPPSPHISPPLGKS